MKSKQTVKTRDGHEINDGDDIFIVEGDKVYGTVLRIGYHDKRYVIFKSKTLAVQFTNRWKIRPI